MNLGLGVGLVCGLLAAPALTSPEADHGQVVQNVAAKRRTFVLATFNVLGHKHTQPGGSKSGYAKSRKRIRWTVRLLERHHVSVAGVQELQWPQKRRFLKLTGDRYAMYSKHGDPDNSIIWRKRRWALVEARTFKIPYFNGDPRHMPIVRLRDKVTGKHSIFINVHNPANTGKHPNQDRHRARAVRREYRVVRRLQVRERVRIFLTGDFNERTPVFCKLSRRGLLHAAAGGRHRDRCQPPEYHEIDWIFGTRRASLLGDAVVNTRLVRRTSDHPLVLARVRR